MSRLRLVRPEPVPPSHKMDRDSAEAVYAPVVRAEERFGQDLDTLEANYETVLGDAWVTDALDWSREVLDWVAAEEAEGVRKPVTVPTTRLNQRVQKALREGRVEDAAELIRGKVEAAYKVSAS